jgi:hypothetical protein
MFLEGLRGERAETIVTHFASRCTDDRQLGRKKPISMERTKRRQQHSLREVASSTEEQECMRSFCHWSHATDQPC